MLINPTQTDETYKKLFFGNTSYFKVTYLSMALLINLSEKKNIILKYLKECYKKLDPEQELDENYKEKISWLVSKSLNLGSSFKANQFFNKRSPKSFSFEET